MYGARDMAGGVQRTKSTKQLISRYETISSPSPPPPKSERRFNTKGFKTLLPSSTNTFRSKSDKSPIRESFRNLFAVFKNAKDSKLDSRESYGGELDKFSKPYDLDTRDDSAQELMAPIPVALDVPASSGGSSTLDSPRLQGDLWYQARLPDGSAHWMLYSAIIESGAIRLIPSDKSFPEQALSLLTCSDVRSLGLLDLPEEERGEIPRGFIEKGYRIFDVYLRPTGRERFAAVSVQQRAKWVSAIWGGIIDDRDRQSTFNTYINDKSLEERMNSPRRADPRRIDRTFSDIDRGLPPVPQETPAMPNVLSPSVYAPTHQMLSPQESYPASRRMNSTGPAATNLSQRSLSANSIHNLPAPIASSPVASVLHLYDGSDHDATTQSLNPPASDRANMRRYSLSDVPSPSSVVAPPGPLSTPSVELHPSTAPVDPLSNLVQTMQQNNAEQRNQLSEVQRDLMNILPNLASLFESHGSAPQLGNLIQLLVQLGNTVQGNHLEVKGILDTLALKVSQGALKGDPIPRDDATALHNVGTGSEGQAQRSPSFNARLDRLTASIEQMRGCGTQGVPSVLNDQVAEMLDLLRKGEVQTANQTTQQADVTRYLAELNTWMKSFSEHSLFHTNTTLVKLDHLSNGLGVQRMEDAASGDVPPPGIINDIRDSLQVLKNRDAHNPGLAELQESVNRALSVGTHGAFTPDMLMTLLEKQRDDQQMMLRTLAAELSNEIKNERLSFVDAMSKATSFDIQAHLDQFKQELTKEVHAMMQEVGRLHLERQAVQSQISEMFSFYNKHQVTPDAAGMLSPPIQSTSGPAQMGGGGGGGAFGNIRGRPLAGAPGPGGIPVHTGPVRLTARDHHGRQLSEAPIPGQYVTQVQRPQLLPIQTAMDIGAAGRRANPPPAHRRA